MSTIIRFGVPACFVATLSTALLAQEKQTPTAPIEITKTDMTKIDKIRSVDLTVFGVALGDATDAAQEKVRAAALRPEVVALPKTNGGRFIRVFDSSQKEIFGITDEGGTVTGLTLRNDLAPRLPGESPKLFSASIMEPESALRLRLLGREDSRTVEHPRGTSITEINISYDKEGIRLSQSYVGSLGDLPPTIHLVMPAKPR
jgi:hypothetical protein